MRLLVERVCFDGPGGNLAITFHRTGLKALPESQLEHAVFQPTAAGYHLEKSLEGNTGVEVWDGFTQPSTDQQAAYISIAMAGNGSRVAARDALGQVQLWDIKTGISKLLPLTVSFTFAFRKMTGDW